MGPYWDDLQAELASLKGRVTQLEDRVTELKGQQVETVDITPDREGTDG